MDINCVSGCAYQTDGKCGLTELPAAARFSMNTASSGGNFGGVVGTIGYPNETSCPYFLEKKPRGPIEFM